MSFVKVVGHSIADSEWLPFSPYASGAKATSIGMFAVKIRFDSDADPQTLSMGSGGTAAIYTNKGKPVHIISKVALRMKKWLLYVLPSVQKS